MKVHLGKVTRAHVRDAAFVLAISTNLVAVVLQLARQEYGSAGVQSLAIVFVAVLGFYMPKITASLEAQIAMWTAQRDTAQLFYTEALRHKGDVDRHVATARPVVGRAH